MTDRELDQKLLEALEWAADHSEPDTCKDGMCPICTASEALRERLSRPDPADCDGQCGNGAYCDACPKRPAQQEQGMPDDFYAFWETRPTLSKAEAVAEWEAKQKPARQEPVAWMHQDTLAAMLEARTEARARYPVARLTDYDDKTDYAPLYTTPQPAIPNGYALVPMEPTQAMIDAMIPVEEIGYWAMYEAAIAAAQKEMK